MVVTHDTFLPPPPPLHVGFVCLHTHALRLVVFLPIFFFRVDKTRMLNFHELSQQGEFVNMHVVTTYHF